MHNGENAFEVLLYLYKQCEHHTKRCVFCIEMDSFWKHVIYVWIVWLFLYMKMSTTQNSLKKIPLSLDQPTPLIFLKSLVSSANSKMLLVTPSSRSLMYIKNKIGPSTDPCGTPLKTGFQFETSPSTTTLCLLSVSHCCIQFIILIPIPWDFNLSISLWCGTLSNAFWKSK